MEASRTTCKGGKLHGGCGGCILGRKAAGREGDLWVKEGFPQIGEESELLG